MKTSLQLRLSLSESTQLKGIALMLLLCHHLFYIQNGLYDDIMIKNHGLVQEFGMICKVCVALFVFLSGYGLTKKYAGTSINIRRFYVERFAKLMPSFWLIWILFVPVGVFCFGRTSDVVYGSHCAVKLIIQFLGLQDFVGFYGFNATWWFMSCIIGLYLLYPLLMLIIQKGHTWWLLGGCFLLMFVPIPHSAGLNAYLFPFVVGVYCVEGVLPPPRAWLLIPLILLTVAWRQFGIIVTGVKVDAFLTLEIVLLYRALDIKNKYLTTSLEFIGRHSMNIFLFHTFIYYYYFENYIYYTGNPLLIFITLLLVCLLISAGIEYLKKKLHFQQCSKTIMNKLI